MRILLDQDQVLAEFVEKVLKWYNEDNKTNYTAEDVKNYYDLEKLVGLHFVRSCVRYPDFYSDLDPVHGAIEGVKQLIDDGHDVCIVSAVPKSGAISFHGKLVWIRKHMPFFDLKNFVACSRKELVQGDILLDDAPHNCKAFLEKTGKISVLFSQPWNRNIDSKDYTHRIFSWKEFLSLVNVLS